MTAIVGLKHGGKVYLGADSAGSNGFNVHIRSDLKVFRNGDFLFGFTGSFRAGQLLRYVLQIPHCPEATDSMQFMVGPFVDSVRLTLRNGGELKLTENLERGIPFIVGWRNDLFVIESDFQVGQVHKDYVAVGIGENVCLGSLFSTRGEPRKRITTALEAASEFCVGVRGPFTILE